MATFRVLPDASRVALCLSAPEVGPRILFFTGGTALRGVAEKLVAYTHNSIHLVTPFDSGGSSARLRTAFGMLAIGDLRNRMMALADRSVRGHPSIVSLFGSRFSQTASLVELRMRLDSMIGAEETSVQKIPEPMQRLIRDSLMSFRDAMPSDFDLRGASIGNLILAGRFLDQGRRIEPVISLFSKLAAVRGIVQPVTSEALHLASELEDGRVLIGQHLIAGKEKPPPACPIRTVSLSRDDGRLVPSRGEMAPTARDLVGRADLICFPIGSFFSSLLANLLPQGVGSAVAESKAPKIYIPNPGVDPEERGVGLARRVELILETLRADAGHATSVNRLLDLVIVDCRLRQHDNDIDRIEALGVGVIDLPLAGTSPPHRLDETLFIEVVLSLASER